MSGAGGFWVLQAVGKPEGRELAAADDVRSLPRPPAAGAEGGSSEEQGGQGEARGDTGESERGDHVLFQVRRNAYFTYQLN